MRRLRHLFTYLLTFSALASVPATAQTLSSIRDTVHNADGSSFNGQLIISWQAFTSATGASIAPHSTALNITNGYISVVLVPTTNASAGAVYTAQYESNDGTKQWTEYWQVPPSWTPLTLSEIRVANPPNTGGSGNGGGSGAITLPLSESNVINLSADLSARAVKGSSYAPAHAAMIDDLGAISSVSGNGGDCVHVDGSSGACGSAAPYPLFVDADLPSGSINGFNPVFTLSQTPSPSTSLSLYRNGMMQRQGVDYSVAANTVTFVPGATPQTGDILTAFYRTQGSGSAAQFIDAETPSGTIDGFNTIFSLASTPNPAASLQLFRNGALQRLGIDFTLSANTITFAGGMTPRIGDSLLAFYRH